MPKFDYDIGIIGGGAAGLTVAAGSAQLGAKTLLIEKEGQLGGDCLHFGCVPSKTLIKSAKVYHLLKNTKNFGLPPVDIPPVDFSSISKRIQGVINTIQKHDSVDRFCGFGVKVLFGAPSFTDPHTVILSGEKISAKNWVIATGSSAGVLPIKGIEDTPYITNQDIFTLPYLPESIAVLGAGPIAIEMAQAFCRLGSKVHVIQRSGQILSKEDKDMADGLMEILADEGVKFHLNSSTIEVAKDGNATAVSIKNKDVKEKKIKADKLLIAMGRTPNLEGLNLENAGVEYDKKGIRVDNRLRTANKNIYAAGDITGAYQFTHAAGYEGGIVLSNAIFHLPRKTDYTLLPWCTYTDPELASIGMNEKRAKEAGIKYRVWIEEFKDNDRGIAEGNTSGKIKMILNEKEKPIGIQILGMNSGDLLNEWVAVLNGGVRLSTLASAIHPYPTLGEINKRVAGAFLSPKIFSSKVQKGLKFFFHLKGRACELDDKRL